MENRTWVEVREGSQGVSVDALGCACRPAPAEAVVGGGGWSLAMAAEGVVELRRSRTECIL